jgi:hypothetical protein
MRPLDRCAALQLWDTGEGLAPVARASLLLAQGRPDATLESLEALSLGRRDAELLRLRELTFGSRLDINVVCPHCGERMVCAVECNELVAELPADQGVTHSIELAGQRIEFRLPTGADLAAAVLLGTPELIVGDLTARCVLHPRPAEHAFDEQTIAAIAQRMLELDPLAEVVLELSCGRCNRSAQHLFDIAEFFWAEIRSYAQRLLQDIDTLARAYGWREGDILALTDKRRARYLQLTA